MDKAVIQKVCQLEFGAPPLDITRKTIGICNEVYEVKFADNSYILRMNQEKRLIYGTHKFLPLFQKLNIKVPAIIAEDYSKSKFPFCYQIQSKLEGKDLVVVFHELSAASLRAIAKEISLVFDKFNTLPHEQTFGGLTGMHEEHKESLLTILEDKKKDILARNKISNVLDQEIIDIYDHLIKEYKAYFLNVKPKLYYDDMNSKNVMIHNGQFNGLVDLDFLSKGDYLEGIGGIIAAWYGSESGTVYINAIFEYQNLSSLEQKIANVYAITHLIGWTSEAGIKHNSNTSGTINWSRVAANKRKIIDLYNSIL